MNVVYKTLIGNKYNKMAYRLDRIMPCNKKWKHICFTDNINLVPGDWEIVHVDIKNLEVRKIAKKIKILHHEFLGQFDLSLYIGSRFKIAIKLDHFVKQYLCNVDMVAVKHNKRRCIYQEAKKIISLNLDNHLIVKSQIKRYRREGFPSNFGLAAFIFFLRKNNTSVNKFMQMWFEEILHGSSRDLLSHDYIRWKCPIAAKYIAWDKAMRIFN